jgi:NACalpha-BTF3-like transcription factor
MQSLSHSELRKLGVMMENVKGLFIVEIYRLMMIQRFNQPIAQVVKILKMLVIYHQQQNDRAQHQQGTEKDGKKSDLFLVE